MLIIMLLWWSIFLIKIQSCDDISNYASLAVDQLIEYEQVDAENLLHNKKVVYIDQNIISAYCSEKNKNSGRF